MIAVLLGLLAAGSGVAAGAPWWTLLAAAPFAVPGRVGPAVGAAAVVALLPWDAGPAWRDALLAASGVLAGWAVLYRIGHAVPWVAVPWWAAGLAVLTVAWTRLPPDGYWSESDVAVRLRIFVLAALACVGLAVTYLPRYRNEAPALPGPEVPPAEGGGGIAGAREDIR